MALVKRKAYPHPVSTAKNSYTLLDDVKEVILEEPSRMYMGLWETTIDDLRERFAQPELKGPACGKLGCISGWVSFLKPDANESSTMGKNILAPRLTFLADANNDAYFLRADLREALNNLFNDTAVDAEYGTKKYATIVAKRITAFQKQWAAELKAINID